MPVPATPGWTVQDVVAHLAGIVDDGIHGNMVGAPGDAWTAAQVAKRHGWSMADVLAEWEANAPTFESVALRFPPMADITTHEQDLRGALARPGARESAELAYLLPIIVTYAAEHLAERHSGVVTVRAGAEEVTAGEGAAVLALSTSPWELLRSVFGRRSAAQLHALPWQGVVDVDVTALCVFGPRDTDLLE